MYQVAIVPFMETPGFLSILDNQTREIYAVPKSICEIFAISWNSQHTKLNENASRWLYQTIMLKLPGDDRKRKVGIIPEKKARSWVCSINPEKVKDSMREQLIAFQDECDAVLHDYWTKGIAINPRSNPQIDSEFQRFIGEIIRTSVTEAIREFGATLSSAFVSQKTFSDFSGQCEKRFLKLEKSREIKEIKAKNVQPSEKISMEQVQMLRTLVKEKGQTRKGIMKIWREFKTVFRLDTYSNLPQCQFNEALLWLNRL